MAALNLFPARIAFVDAQGRLTPEAYRALNQLFERVGGTFGDQGADTFAVLSSSGDSASLMPIYMISAPVEQPFFAEMISQPASVGYEAPEIFQRAD